MYRLDRRFRHGKIRFCISLDDKGPVRLDQRGVGKFTTGSLPAHESTKAVTVQIVKRARLVEHIRHRERGALQIPGVLADIGFGDRERRVDNRLGADFEPPIEPDIQRNRSDDSNHNRRNYRDERKQRHDAHMQPRGRLAALPTRDDTMDLTRDQAGKQEDERRVDADQHQSRRFVRRDGRQAGEDDEGNACDKQRADNGDKAGQNQHAAAFKARTARNHLSIVEIGLNRHVATHCLAAWHLCNAMWR